MSLCLSLDEFLGYSSEECGKWERWFEQQPAALGVPVQPDGRFATVWRLIDHIFVTERRHTLRLIGDPNLPETTGVTEGDVAGLFGFGREARARLAAVAGGVRPEEAGAVREFRVRGVSYHFTPRKLIFHILMHEVRHWAQIAAAVRNAGYAPPGNHDLLFTGAMR